MTTPRKSGRGRQGRRARPRKGREPASVAATEVPAAAEPPAEEPEATPVVAVEPLFAARVPPPRPPAPPPSRRCAVFFDVENTSRAEHIARVLAHLELDWMQNATELVGVGNWRVIGHDTARLLASRGAHLVHSAPSVGVRDWSDLRIAVSAGAWLAAARPGDVLQIVTDDQAFDAVGDVAASLGVTFRRLSYRALAGLGGAPVLERTPERSSRRRRRGSRRDAPSRPAVARAEAPASNGGAPAEAHTAPHDELLAVARELIAASSERAVGIDALSNALKERGFRRTPGSPRLVTRLRRIKELDVNRQGTVRLLESAGDEPLSPEPASAADQPEQIAEGTPSGLEGAAAPAARRRRRRRGGRHRRGRGSPQSGAPTE